jgi:hypothetical protein
MAAPHVTGVAALLKAQNPSLDWRAIKNLILAGGDSVSSLQETITGKRLNAYGALTCSNKTVTARLLPVADTVSGSVGTSITLSTLNINCAQPAGTVTVGISPGNQIVTLSDDGTGSDLASQDGIYSGSWTPSSPGSYTLTFPDGSAVAVQVLTQYGSTQTSYNYQSITGTNLNLGDDSVALVSSPFPVLFGGGSFSQLYVSSNGTISFTAPFDAYQNYSFAPNGFPNTEKYPTTLVAPWWQDLYPVKGTNQNVFWELTGSTPNRSLVVEWRNVRAFQCRSDNSATVTFEVVFKEGTSDVLFNYSDAVFGGNCSNLDYGQSATTGLLLSPAGGVMWNDGSNPGLADGLAVLWQSPPAVGSTNPAPTLTAILPASAPVLSPDLTIRVTGTNFVPSSIVQWRNTNLDPLPPPINLPTTYVSGTQLTAIIPSQFLAPFSKYVVGTVQAIMVTNPGPGGGATSALPFTILPPGPPTISSLTPSSATAGDFSFVLDVKGTNLYAAVIAWNGNKLQTFEVSNAEVTASVPSNLLVSPGTAQITAVVTGPNGTVISTPVPFTINATPQQLGASTNSSYLKHQNVDSDGTAKLSIPQRQPIKFLGWNIGRKQGAAYLQHFSRPYGGANIAPSKMSTSSPRALEKTSGSALPQLSLSQPSGLPGFAFHPTSPTGYLPTSVTTGDFNRDGKMDWAVSNGGSNDVWIYFGNGDGTAGLPTIVNLTGAAPTQVVAADLRKIGVLDLVVAEADSQSIGVLLGNGDGTFQTEVTYYIPGPPLSVAVADVNGDGKLDVVAGIVGGPLQGPFVTFLGDGTGKFGAPITTPAFSPVAAFFTTSVVLKDLNGDGLPDAIVIDQGSVVAGAHSYLNNGDGTFKHADFFFESGGIIVVTSVAVGEMDGDGCPDAVTGEALGLVRIFRGTCDGGFQGFPNVATFGAGEAPVSVALADMNGDGHLDVITGGGFFGVGPGFGQEASNLVTVLFGDGAGSLSPPKVYRDEPSLHGLAVADLNGDGKPEVIVASQDTDTSAVLKNDGKGNLDGPTGGYLGYITAGQSGNVNAPYSPFLVQDIDGDGKPDIALLEAEPTTSSAWEFAVLLNDGSGHFGAPVRTPVSDFGPPPSGYALGDFRNTGRPDLIAWEQSYQGTGDPNLAFFPNIGGGQFGRGRFTAFNPNQLSGGILTTGDFNGDGKLDFVLATSLSTGSAQTASQLVFFKGNGDGTFQQGGSVSFGTGTPPFMIFAGDFNHDGRLDVLVWVYDNIVGVQNHNVYEFLGNGDGTFSAAKLILPNFGFFGMADLNHDGLPDIVEFNQQATTANPFLDLPVFTVYLGQPDGTFKRGQTYSPYSGTVYPGYGFSNVGPSQILSPMLADFNGDGNMDIGVVMEGATYPHGSSYLQVLAGNGDGTFTPTYEVTLFDKFGFPSNAADVNGDSRADLLQLDGWPSSFHVIPNLPGPTVQLTFPTRPVVGNKGSVNVNLSLVSTTPTTVQLLSSDPNIQIVSTVTIPSGVLTANVPFTIATGFNSSKVFSLSAQLSGQTSTVYSYRTSTGIAGIRLFANLTNESTPPGGTTQDYAVGVTSVGGYMSTVQLSCQGLPTGASCQFGPDPINISPGQAVGSSLTIRTSASTPLGSYPITLVGTDGSVSDQLTLMLKVSDFTIALTPGSVGVLPGNPANFTLQLGTSSGWTDLITVNCTVSGPGNPACNAGGSFFPGSYLFSVSTSGLGVGNYSISVSGTADGVTHSATPVTFQVQGVTPALTPSSASVAVGGTATFQLSLTSQGGYTDQFTFGCPQLPTGLACSFAPVTGTLPANASLASVLTLTATSKPAFASGDKSRQWTRPWLPLPTIVLVLAISLLLRCVLGISGSRMDVWKPVSGFLCILTVMLLAGSLVGCGGGGGGGSPPPQPPGPPPPSPVTVTVTVQATSPTLSITVGTITLQVN